MITIINNLISLPMVLIGFALEEFIFLLSTPIGFCMVFSLLAYFEYLTFISILGDPVKAKIANVLDYIKSFALKDVSLISTQWAVLNIISNKKNVRIKEISNAVGTTIGTTEELIDELIGNGYILNMGNINDRHKFCYVISEEYEEKVRLINV